MNISKAQSISHCFTKISALLQMANAISIHYDAWEDKFDEQITINHSHPTSTKLKPLHTFAPYHAHSFDSSIQPGK